MYNAVVYLSRGGRQCPAVIMSFAPCWTYDRYDWQAVDRDKGGKKGKKGKKSGKKSGKKVSKLIRTSITRIVGEHGLIQMCTSCSDQRHDT